MKHTECKDCELSNGDCGYHFKMDGTINYDIASLSACDKYGNCEFFKSKAKPKGDIFPMKIVAGKCPIEAGGNCPLRPQGKWIPTSEFLPEEYDSYLVMWRFRSGEYDGKLFYEICEYDPDEDEWERIEQAGEAGAEIVAWMPLPERYEPKKDDEDKE